MPRVSTPLCTAWLLLAAAPAAVCAQQIRGSVVDGVASRAVAGVVVSTFDAAGRPLARTLSDETGAFRLLAPGAVRIHLQRLGYRPRDLQLGDALVRDTTFADLAMQPIPLVIGALRVRESQLCRQRSDDAQALALWEQARSGLLASVVAQESRPATMHLLVYDRTRDPRSDSIEAQSTQLVAATSTRPFYAADSARGFARKGYMVAEDGGRRRFFAPDADVLLDPAFAATHCFSVVQGRGDHAGEIGLGFQPAGQRKVDVEGTLWLDPRTPALRTLDFAYTGVDALVRSAGSGGQLRFATLPDGMVFIDDWRIRVGTTGYGQMDRFPRLLDIQEHGGEVVSAAWSDSAKWTGHLPSVQGDVAIAGRRGAAPAPAVQVWLRGTDGTTTTDAQGRFVLEHVLPGPYELRAIDADLAPFGLEQPVTRRILVRDTADAPLHVDVPSRLATAADLCYEPRMPDSLSAILLRAVDTTGAHAKAAEVLAEWSVQGVRQQSTLASRRGATADSAGRAVLCALPRGRALRLRARDAAGLVGDTTVDLADTTALATLVMRLRRPASAEVAHATAAALEWVPHAGGRWSAHAGRVTLTLDLDQDGPDVSGSLALADDARPEDQSSLPVSGELRGDTLLLGDGHTTYVDGTVAKDNFKAIVWSGLWNAAARMRGTPSEQRLAFDAGPTVHFWRVQRR